MTSESEETIYKDLPHADGWGNDKLNRKADATFLAKYLVAKSDREQNHLVGDSFVLNVNAEWGFGKTYFLQNLANDLRHGKVEELEGKYPVIYFDAWKNDFTKEPLVGFIASINEQLESFFVENVEAGLPSQLTTWFGYGKKMVRQSTPLILGIIAKKLTGYSLPQLLDAMDSEGESEESATEEKVTRT